MTNRYLAILVFAAGAALAGSSPEKDEIRLIESLIGRLPDRAAAQFLLAADYAGVGNLPKAMALLKECASAGKGFDPSDEPAFARLRSNPEFRELAARVRRELPAVNRARLAFTLAERDLIPEGIAADPARRVFYIGSLHRRKIVSISTGGAARDFVPEGKYGLLPLCGMKVDPRDHSLWVNGCANEGRGELVHFDAQGALIERFSIPGRHLFNDLVFRGSNDIFLTDSLANAVYRFDRAARAFTPVPAPRPLYYPNGIAISGGERLLWVADAFGVVQFDLATGESGDVDPGRTHTLAGIDGLYWSGGALIAVQNGLGRPRIARYSLSRDGLRVEAVEILERAGSLLELPTTGALMDSRFYFIANSQLRNWRDGRIADPGRLEPVRIGALDLN